MDVTQDGREKGAGRSTCPIGNKNPFAGKSECK